MIGQASRRDELGGLEGDGSFDDVLELADIARPGVGLKDTDGIRGQSLAFDSETSTGPLDEVAGEIGKVVGSLAQGRQVEVEHVEPVEEILSEGALFDIGAEIPVRRRHDPDVELDFTGSAHRSNPVLLEHAQEFRLHGRGQLADLVEQEAAALGIDKEPGMIADRAGEGAADVAEEL